jgi:hypothetical protein
MYPRRAAISSKTSSGCLGEAQRDQRLQRERDPERERGYEPELAGDVEPQQHQRRQHDDHHQRRAQHARRPLGERQEGGRVELVVTRGEPPGGLELLAEVVQRGQLPHGALAREDLLFGGGRTQPARQCLGPQERAGGIEPLQQAGRAHQVDVDGVGVTARQ